VYQQCGKKEEIINHQSAEKKMAAKIEEKRKRNQ
jgi:hypothetical protein